MSSLRISKLKFVAGPSKGLENNCTILAKLLEEYKETVPLAKKIRAMNIDISELLVFDTAVNEISSCCCFPPFQRYKRLREDRWNEERDI